MSNIKSENKVAEQASEPITKKEEKMPPFDNPEQVINTLKTSHALHQKLNTQSQTIRQYLDSSVVPLLMQALQALVKERPDDPIEYVALYLLKFNPSRKVQQNVGPGDQAQNQSGDNQQSAQK